MLPKNWWAAFAMFVTGLPEAFEDCHKLKRARVSTPETFAGIVPTPGTRSGHFAAKISVSP